MEIVLSLCTSCGGLQVSLGFFFSPKMLQAQKTMTEFTTCPFSKDLIYITNDPSSILCKVLNRMRAATGSVHKEQRKIKSQ